MPTLVICHTVGKVFKMHLTKGIIFALGACLIWGLIFVIPEYMEGFNAMEITLGRYFFYGVLSLGFSLKKILQRNFCYPRAIWIKAFYLSLIVSMGYYTFVVLGLRYSSPAICALILGIVPISIAMYGNWKQKEGSFKRLIAPSILIFLGLVIINVPGLIHSPSRSTYVVGLICAFWGLITWTWFAVANARLLRDNSQVHASDWSSLMGITTLFWVGIFALVLVMFFGKEIDFQKYFTLNLILGKFLIGSTILGFLCSWFGAYLWNKGCVYLPISLAGQLTIFETIFGLLFFYTLNACLPSILEAIGILFFLSAVIYAIRSFAKSPSFIKGHLS